MLQVSGLEYQPSEAPSLMDTISLLYTSYRLSGDMADGNLLVNAGENDEIRLVFDGFSIASTDTAPIYISQGGSVTVETAAGTENSVMDGRAYEKTEDDESPDAAIFSECDLILEGEGTLTAVSYTHLDVYKRQSLPFLL